MEQKSVSDQAKETINALIHGWNNNTERGEYVIAERIFSNSAQRDPQRMDAFLAHWDQVLQRLDTVRQICPVNQVLMSNAIGNLHITAGDCMRGVYDTMVKSLDSKAEWCLQVSLKAIDLPGEDRAKTELIVLVLIPQQKGRNVINLYTQAMSLDLSPKPKKQPGDLRRRVTSNQVPNRRHAPA